MILETLQASSTKKWSLPSTAEVIKSIFINPDVNSARDTCVISTTGPTLVSLLKPAPEQPGDNLPHPAVCPNHSGDPVPPHHGVLEPALTKESREPKGPGSHPLGSGDHHSPGTIVQIPSANPCWQMCTQSLLDQVMTPDPGSGLQTKGSTGQHEGQSGWCYRSLCLLLEQRNWTLRQTSSLAEPMSHDYH